MKSTLKIGGMSCGHCVAAVKSAIADLPGVKTLSVTIGEAVVETENLDTVKAAIEEEGYDVLSVH